MYEHIERLAHCRTLYLLTCDGHCLQAYYSIIDPPRRKALHPAFLSRVLRVLLPRRGKSEMFMMVLECFALVERGSKGSILAGEG